MTARWLAVRRGVARGLMAGGIGCLVWVGFTALRAEAFDREQRQVLANARRHERPVLPRAVAPARVERGALIGVLDVPRLGISEVVAEGDDEATLTMAVGHLPDTPLPWLPGNSALAGHRNTHFGALEHIRAGDRITLSTPHGDYHYAVSRTHIVRPDDLSVLASATGRELTLITCYPFRYIGNAPKRFVIHARADDRH